MPFALPSGTVADAKDEAGADMWFNGRPSFAPNIAGPLPAGRQGRSTAARSSAPASPSTARMKPWKVRFPKAGTYRLTLRLPADRRSSR